MLFACFRVVNGALEYLSKDLGILENTVVQGKDCNIFKRCYFSLSISHPQFMYVIVLSTFSVTSRAWFSYYYFLFRKF